MERCRDQEDTGQELLINFLVDDGEMAVIVNAVIYVECDQTKQMTVRKMEEL